MKIHLYYTDNSPAEMLDAELSGVTTFDTEHRGQKRVKRIVDISIAQHPDYDAQVLCEPMEKVEEKA